MNEVVRKPIAASLLERLFNSVTHSSGLTGIEITGFPWGFPEEKSGRVRYFVLTTPREFNHGIETATKIYDHSNVDSRYTNFRLSLDDPRSSERLKQITASPPYDDKESIDLFFDTEAGYGVVFSGLVSSAEIVEMFGNWRVEGWRSANSKVNVDTIWHVQYLMPIDSKPEIAWFDVTAEYFKDE